MIFHCIYVPPFIYSPADGPLRCFQLLAVVINAAMNVYVQISLRVPAFDS